MNNYEQMCLELDKELAVLLWWSDVIVTNTINGVNTDGFYSVRNRWTQDDGEAFRLMVEHDVSLTFVEDFAISVISEGAVAGLLFDIEDFPTKSCTMRVGIVEAVIAKLSQ